MAATAIALPQAEMPLAHELRGRVGMWCLIAAESAIFSIFVVAYLYYAGKSLSGPTPREVLRRSDLQLDLPVLQQLHDCDGRARHRTRQEPAVRNLVVARRSPWERSSSWAPLASGTT